MNALSIRFVFVQRKLRGLRELSPLAGGHGQFTVTHPGGHGKPCLQGKTQKVVRGCLAKPGLQDMSVSAAAALCPRPDGALLNIFCLGGGSGGSQDPPIPVLSAAAAFCPRPDGALCHRSPAVGHEPH